MTDLGNSAVLGWRFVRHGLVLQPILSIFDLLHIGDLATVVLGFLCHLLAFLGKGAVHLQRTDYFGSREFMVLPFDILTVTELKGVRSVNGLVRKNALVILALLIVEIPQCVPKFSRLLPISDISKILGKGSTQCNLTQLNIEIHA